MTDEPQHADDKLERAVGVLILIAASCEARHPDPFAAEIGLAATDALKDIVGEDSLRLVAEQLVKLRRY